MKNARTIALHRIEIPTPCTASWDLMQGDDRVRHCGSCNKNVFNLSAMAEDEAADLLAGNADGHLCVRFYRRSDGTVLTSDCGARTPSASRQAWTRLAGATALALSAAACSAGDKPPAKPLGAKPVTVNIVPEQPVSMGAVAPEPPMVMGKPMAPVEPVAPVQPLATMGAPPPPRAEPADDKAH
jgi:hypothetical protein